MPEVHSLEAVTELARQKTSSRPVRAALVVSDDPGSLGATYRAFANHLISPVLLGEEKSVSRVASELGVKTSGAELIETTTQAQAVTTAAEMAERGDVDLLIQGNISAHDLLSGLLAAPNFRRKGRIVSHVAVFKTNRYPKLLLLSDGGVVAQPTLEDKLQLIHNISRLAGRIGVSNPKIAVVTAVEAIYTQMPANLDGAVLAKMSERGQIKDAIVDGPLSLDIAVDPEAAAAKGITNSPVAGQADAFLVPSIEVANGIYHAMTLFGHADIGGVLMGGRVPVAMNSLTARRHDRFHSIVLAIHAAIR